LADIAANTKSQGVILNDSSKVSQNTAILKSLFLNSTTPVFLPSGTIYFNDTLVIGNNVQVFGTPQTTLICTNLTVNCVTISDGSTFKNCKIQLLDGHTGAALFLGGSSQINMCAVEDIYIVGVNTCTATGILLSSKQKNTWVCNANFNRIHLKYLKYGITLEDDQLNGNGWVNANTFKNLFIWANYGIYINTGSPSSNEFDFQFQTLSTTVEGFRCCGWYNKFSGFVWDIKSYGGTGKIYNLLPSAKYNIIDIPFSDDLIPYCLDNGINNVVSSVILTQVYDKNKAVGNIVSVVPGKNTDMGVTDDGSAGSTVTIYRTGKNLYPPARTNSTQSLNGVTYTLNGQTQTLNGTATGNGGRGLFELQAGQVLLKAGVLYSISCNIVSGSYTGTAPQIFITNCNNSGDYQSVNVGTAMHYRPTTDKLMYLGIQAFTGSAFTNCQFNYQVERNDDPTAYESYVGSVFSGVSLTETKIPAIPNYTGANYIFSTGNVTVTYNKKPNSMILYSGTTAQRPASSTILVGQSYSDTSLNSGNGMLIVWNGTNWVNPSTGATV
jgi:hypothetical protein